MKKKCPSCNSCLDLVWLMPNRYYHCWFEDVWYTTIGNEMAIIDIYKVSGYSKLQVDKIMESYE